MNNSNNNSVYTNTNGNSSSSDTDTDSDTNTNTIVNSNDNTVKNVKNKTKRVSWIPKHKTKIKTYHQYVTRQLKIARRICMHMVNLLNRQEIDEYCNFVDTYYDINVNMHVMCTGTCGLTREMNVDKNLIGRDAIKTMMTQFITNIPDFILIVENIHVLNDGRLVRIELCEAGTPMNNISIEDLYTFNPNSNTTRIEGIKQTYVYSVHVDIYLSRTNIIEKIIYNGKNIET